MPDPDGRPTESELDEVDALAGAMQAAVNNFLTAHPVTSVAVTSMAITKMLCDQVTRLATRELAIATLRYYEKVIKVLIRRYEEETE